MKPIHVLAVLAAASIALSSPARAQYYGGYGGAYRQGYNNGGSVIPYLYQQQQAADQAAQQQAQAEAQRQAAARQAVIDRRNAAVEATRQADAAAASRLEAQRRVDEQAAAENSPDNYCRSPTMAREIMEEFGKFKLYRTFDVQAVDMEHVTTVRAEPERKTFVCHATMVLTNGRKVTGVFSIRPNIAGDMISQWRMD
jgi:ATPase subunit of ABC transporter with duplicated ATPase domains